MKGLFFIKSSKPILTESINFSIKFGAKFCYAESVNYLHYSSDPFKGEMVKEPNLRYLMEKRRCNTQIHTQALKREVPAQ